MAEYKGDNYTKATTANSDQIEQGLWGGKLRVQVDEYTANSLASGDTIDVASLPKGATFIRAIIVHEDLGTGVTLQMGDSGDDDRYLAASSAASAGTLEANALTGFGYQLTEDTDLFLKIGGASTASSDKTIRVATIYSLE